MLIQSLNDKKDKESIYAFLEDKIAKWWKPDDIVFVDELPIGATGKVLKIELREQFKDHLMKQGGKMEAIKPEDERMNCCRVKKVPDECLMHCKRGNKTASSRFAPFYKCRPWLRIISECKKGILIRHIFQLQLLII